MSRRVEQDWITVTDGEDIDYDKVEADIVADTGLLRFAEISYDEWSGEPVRQRLEKRTGVPMLPMAQTYKGMTAGMTEHGPAQVTRLVPITATRSPKSASTPSSSATRPANLTSSAQTSPNVAEPESASRSSPPPRWRSAGGSRAGRRSRSRAGWW